MFPAPRLIQGKGGYSWRTDTTIKTRFRTACLIAKESIKSFQKNGNFDTSASLAYYGFFSFIPIFFIVTSFMSTYISESRVIMAAIQTILSRIFPHSPQVIADEILFLSEHRNAVGIFGFLALFWSITPLTNAVRSTFSKSFKVDKETPFLKAIFLDVLAVSVILILFGALLISEVFFFAFEESYSGTFLLTVIDYIGPLVGTFMAIFLFYAIFSPVRLQFRQLFLASAIASFLWALIREIFSRVLVYNPHYGFAFGSLKAIFIIILWSYFSFCVLLFCLEIMANLRTKEVIVLKDLFLKPFSPKKRQKGLIGQFIKSYNGGEEIFREGDRGDQMYYIVAGSVRISSHGQPVATLGEGEYFGEYSMLLDEPRVSTAVVLESGARLALISETTFQTILRENPAVAVTVLKKMASRLKVLNQVCWGSNLQG